MALIYAGQPCALCDKPIKKGHSLFATWGVWLPAFDRLSHYCDAAMHWDCYAAWTYRHRFARSYFEFWVEEERQNPFWYRVYVDENVLVEVNPDNQVAGVVICLAETGSRHSIHIVDWEWWLSSADEGHHQIETEAIHVAKAILRQQRPTIASLLQGIDRSSKTELFRQLKEADAKRAELEVAKKLEIAKHNSLCERVMRVILQSDYRCPSCDQKAGDFRLATRAGSKSLIICRQCGQTVDLHKFESSVASG